MANTSAGAFIELDTDRTIGEISPLIFGGFAEHLGRCIYEGIYDPASPYADEDGLRRDLLAALRELDFTVMRYPGGNYVSGANWLDGVGPKDQRPRRRELAWASIETNQFGTDEFMRFCAKVRTEPMMGLNFGTGSITDAANLVEYCNAPVGSKYSDLRAANGSADPYNVKYWCLGNEMDGPWQIGHLSAEDYAKKAREAGKMMKWMDPSIKLISCGSSHIGMPTFPEWDRVTLETCWDQIDYHSMHMYAENDDNDTPSFLASSVKFEDYVDALAATVRYVKAKRRSKRDVFLSWDEWNVWYKNRDGNGKWAEAPHLLEEIYNLEDALVVAQWMSVFLRRCDVVKMACLAQIVNVIAPILTDKTRLVKQTIFYPFMFFRKFARGVSLEALVKSPRYECKRYGDVPTLDVSATHDPATGNHALFLVNRGLTETVRAEVNWSHKAPAQVTEAWQMSGTDPKAANTFDLPEKVVPKAVGGLKIVEGKMEVELPALSFTVVGAR